MKVKDIAEQYGLNSDSFEEFLENSSYRVRRMISGSSIDDSENISAIVEEFIIHEKEKIASRDWRVREKLEQLAAMNRAAPLQQGGIMKKCPRCGNENYATARNCTSCGGNLSVNPESEIEPNSSLTTNDHPAVGANRQENHTEKMGYQRQVITEAQNQLLLEILKGTSSINENIRSIKSWVTFFGILALIGLIFSLISSCGALLML